jgi:peptidoglycan hydrolase CwlO-like protein
MERLVQQLAAHLNDPFADVNNIIQKMIFHLMNEQTQEDEHKAWCDNELSHNNASAVDKETKIEDLTMKIDTADAFVVKLTSDISEAQDHIAMMSAFMKEATEIRSTGKKENAAAIADAQKAQSAIADATAVIKSFYKESGRIPKESWELLQKQKHAGKQPVELSGPPETWGSSYTGVGEPDAQPAGMIAVLEKVGAEFATMESNTEAQEATDQAQFEEDIKDNEIAKAGREQEVETKSAEKSRQLDILSSLTKARKHTSDELEQVEQYLKDLVPACVAGDGSYESRKAARETEIGALSNAQKILAVAFAGSPAPAPAAASASLLAPTKKFLEARHH